MIFLIGYIDIVDMVNGMFLFVVVLVVCILLCCVYILVNFMGVRVIGKVNCLLKIVVERLSDDIFFSICCFNVMLVKLVLLCLSVCFW